MCKIISFTNASKLDIKKASEVIGEILLGIERDGYGYAVQGSQNVFGEKCVAPKFTSRLNAHNVVDLPIIEKRQSLFGVADKPTGAAIFHGRTSTNDKGLLNCHPMQRDGWHLIHNGVVTDHGEKYKKITTNDSEDVLTRLIAGIEQVEKHLSGYYAFCAIDPQGRLHVARDSIATLYMAKVPRLDSYIIATTESLIELTCKKLKLKHGAIDKIASDSYAIFDNGVMISSQKIKPRGYDQVHAGYASLSLGRELAPACASAFSALDSYGYAGDSILDSIGNGYASEQEQDDTLTDLMQELADLDDSYVIRLDGVAISAREFYQLDNVRQLSCEIIRNDGTRLDIDLLAS